MRNNGQALQGFLACIVALCGFPAKSFVQELKIGQQIPLLKFDNVYNTDKRQLDLRDIKARLIIFDFWATNCSGCIKAFPKLDSIQAAFKNEVQIILVNPESLAKTEAFFAQRKLLKPRVPFITSDTLLSGMFPHDGVPYHVWIDEDRKVRYLTGGSSTAIETVSEFLAGNNPALGNKVESGRATVAPFWNREYESKLEYFSVLSHYVKGNQYSYSDSLRNRLASIGEKCLSAVQLYQKAFEENGKYDFGRPGRLLVTLKNAYPYMKPVSLLQYEEWKRQYLYNYKLLLPLHRKQEMYHVMRQDMDRFFGLQVTIEKKQTMCLVLSSTTGINRLLTKGGDPVNTFRKSNEYGISNEPVRLLQNLPYDYFSRNMAYWIEKKFEMPFADATGFSGNIDIAISGTAIEELSIELLNRELEKYDLRIEEKLFDLEVLVITDR